MTASVTLEGPENLITHIEGLQAALTKRNAEIERLRDERETLLEGEPTQEALQQAYQRGWNAAVKFQTDNYHKVIASTRGALSQAYEAIYRLEEAKR